MALPLPRGVRYAIRRNNVDIPLVPIDQLPYRLEGFPQQVDPLRCGIEGWKLVGVTQQPSVLLTQDLSTELLFSHAVSLTKPEHLPPDHDVRRNLAQRSHTFRQISPAPVPSREYLTASPNEPSSSDRSGSGFPNSMSRLAGITSDPSKKEYCTHWIRHNSCDFVQQGCRYKHEMPDREKLRELGFPDIPQWYKAKMAISAGSSNWLRPTSAKGHDNRQLSIEPSTSVPQVWRCLTTAHGHIKSSDAETPRSLSSRLNETPDQIADLIDLDDSSVKPTLVASALPIESLSSAASQDVIETITKPTGTPIETFAPSLGTAISQNADVPNLTESKIPISSRHEGSSPEGSCNSVAHQSRLMNTINDRITRNSTTMDSKILEAKKNDAIALETPERPDDKTTDSPKSPRKCTRTPSRKPVESSVAGPIRLGLGSSRHAANRVLKEAQANCKNIDCRGTPGGLELQYQTAPRQNAKPRVALPVATDKGKATVR